MLEFLVLASPDRLQHWLMALLVNAVLIAVVQRLPLLTPQGWVHAGVLGTVLLGSLDWPGWWAVVLYLAIGSLVTRLGFRRKQEQGLAEGRGGRRGPENVWGSAATGAVLAVLSVLSCLTRRTSVVPSVLTKWKRPWARAGGCRERD